MGNLTMSDKNISVMLENMKELEFSLEEISMEAGFLSNALSKVTNFLKSGYNSIKETLSNFFTVDDRIVRSTKKMIKKKDKIFKAIKKDVDFLKVSPVLIGIPEGLKTNLVDLGDTLKDIGTEMLPDIENKIAAFNVTLASVISNSDYRSSFKDQVKLYKEIGNNVSKYSNMLGSNFDRNSTNDRRVLGSLIRNLDDVAIILSDLETLDNLYNTTKLKDLKDGVDSVNQKLSMLINLLEEDKLPDVSPQTIKNIIEGTRNIARYVELAGIVNYTFMQHSGAVYDVTHVLYGKKI